MQAALGLASAENEATAAEGVARAARTQLNAVLGMPLDATPMLTTAIDEGMPPTAESAASLARTASAELAVFDRRIDEQRARIALAHALRGPVLTPTGTLVRDNQPEFDYGWRAGVSVTLPIFTTHNALVTVEETTLDQLNAERQAALLRITGDVTAAAVTADTQRQLYTRYRDQILPQALQVEQLAQDAYQLGQTGVAALLQALQATRDVRLRSLDAVSQLQIALADLERAIGAPLP
jgi:cobalt-zinc-cadmium efflux system outer membrane protein